MNVLFNLNHIFLFKIFFLLEKKKEKHFFLIYIYIYVSIIYTLTVTRQKIKERKKNPNQLCLYKEIQVTKEKQINKYFLFKCINTIINDFN